METSMGGPSMGGHSEPGPDRTPAAGAGPARQPVVRKVLHWLLVAAALAYLAYEAPRLLGSVEAATGELGHLSGAWAAAALLQGLAAVGFYGELHRELLTVGGVRVALPVIVSITLVQNAISSTVPAVGAPGSAAYVISRLRRRGADSALATWVVLLAGVLDILCLVALGAIALGAIGRLSPPVVVIVVVGVAAGAGGAWTLLTRSAVLHQLLRPVLWLDRFLPAGCRDCRNRRAADLDGFTRRITTRLTLLRPSPRQWSLLIGVTVLTWLLDFGTLTTSAASFLRPVPWPALVVGFLVVQGAIALAVLPGGAGLAEVGLLGVLLGAGFATGPAAATVLVYRGAGWLIPAVVGWLNYGIQIHATQPRRHVHGLQPAIGRR
jgi:putative heme transporter